MTDESGARTYHCQMSSCGRPATGDFTRKMYRGSHGEEYPDDVRELPVCWRHYVIDRMIESGMAAGMFGMIVGGVAWWNGADSAAYFYFGVAVVAGLALSFAISALRKGQVIIRD